MNRLAESGIQSEHHPVAVFIHHCVYKYGQKPKCFRKTAKKWWVISVLKQVALGLKQEALGLKQEAQS